MRLRAALRALTAVDNVDNYRRQVLGLAHLSNKLSRQNRRGRGGGWGAASLEKFQMGKRRCCHHNQRTPCLTPPRDPSLIVINACCGTWGVLRVALVSGTHNLTHTHTHSDKPCLLENGVAVWLLNGGKSICNVLIAAQIEPRGNFISLHFTCIARLGGHAARPLGECERAP